jgi:hypothetical protein
VKVEATRLMARKISGSDAVSEHVTQRRVPKCIFLLLFVFLRFVLFSLCTITEHLLRIAFARASSEVLHPYMFFQEKGRV